MASHPDYSLLPSQGCGCFGGKRACGRGVRSAAVWSGLIWAESACGEFSSVVLEVADCSPWLAW